MSHSATMLGSTWCLRSRYRVVTASAEPSTTDRKPVCRSGRCDMHILRGRPVLRALAKTVWPIAIGATCSLKEIRLLLDAQQRAGPGTWGPTDPSGYPQFSWITLWKRTAKWQVALNSQSSVLARSRFEQQKSRHLMPAHAEPLGQQTLSGEAHPRYSALPFSVRVVLREGPSCAGPRRERHSPECAPVL